MMFLPLIAFFVLIAAGLWLGELNIKRALLFVAIWVFGLVGFGLLELPRAFFVAVEAILDCILLLMIFGGDIRIR